MRGYEEEIVCAIAAIAGKNRNDGDNFNVRKDWKRTERYAKGWR